MLGWFKKKLKKKEEIEDTSIGQEPLEEIVQEEAKTEDTPTGVIENVEEPLKEDMFFEVSKRDSEDAAEATGTVSSPAAIPAEVIPELEPAPSVEKTAEPVKVDEAPTADAPEETASPPEYVVTENPEPEIETEAATSAKAADVEEVTTAPEIAATKEEPEPEKTVAPPRLKEQEKPRHATIWDKEQQAKEKEAESKNLFSRLTDRLSKASETFTYQLDTIFIGRREIDGKLLDDLEELLITADLGVSTTQEILEDARRKVKRKELSDPALLKTAIKDRIKSFIDDYQEDAELVMPDEGPFVIMVVGVNGVGKTTTIGKVAHKFINSGQSVLLVAADTFRAAAISQLKIWGERNNVPVAAQDEGSDPSAVVFDAMAHASSKGYDVIIVDTAGRLHTQANLMEELKKIKRVIGKKIDGAPHEVMLIIDATTGQNGISQAKLFNEAVGVTGIALTKLDGTAKGGIVANICKELKTPIRFIGIGEGMEDLRDFDSDEFARALFQDRLRENA